MFNSQYIAIQLYWGYAAIEIWHPPSTRTTTYIRNNISYIPKIRGKASADIQIIVNELDKHPKCIRNNTFMYP